MASPGYIGEDGKYHRGESKKLIHDINPEARRNRQEIERKIYDAEIIQPHIGGEPNPAFIQAYIDDPIVHEYFDQETIDKNMRKVV
jgi:hypothetical protein